LDIFTDKAIIGRDALKQELFEPHLYRMTILQDQLGMIFTN